jgi:hypothetical protein
VSSDTIFEGRARGDPYYHYCVEDMDNNFVDYSPRWSTPVFIDYSLEKGDSTYQDIYWYQRTNSSLKAYTRSYFMYITLEGHDSLAKHYVRKNITLVPNGDRYSVKFHRNYYYPSCYVYDFLLRNRFPDDTTLTLIHPNTLSLEWYNKFPDSLVKTQSFNLNYSSIDLRGFSTWRYRLLFDFTDPELQDLYESSYKVIVKLRTEGQTFIDSTVHYRNVGM